jgi:cell division protein FtsA
MKSIPSLVRGQGRLMASLSPRIVAAVDIGSVKTACMIAECSSGKKSTELDPRHGVKILGFGQTVSRGVKSGAIADVVEAERAIRLAVDAAERMARTTIKSIHVNITGGRPTTVISSAHVRLATGVVTQQDVDTAIAHAVSQADVGRRHVLHLLPLSFSLDGVSAPQPPIGMHGSVLAANISVVTMDAAPLQNLRIAVERCHLTLESVALTPLAVAQSVLTADELELGTILIDLGGYTTNVAVFQQGRLAGSAVLPLGGQHISHDIAHGLSTTVAHAERLKTLFGSVLGSGHDERELLAVPLLGERGVDTVQKVPRHVLTSIVLPRVDELIERVVDLFVSGPLAGLNANRVVITGGGSQLHGIREFVATKLGLPVRHGAPNGFQGMPEIARSAGFAAVSGLLVVAIAPPSSLDMPQEARMALDRSQLTYARRVGRWLAEAF